jgi:hypothetical protein
MDKVRPIGNLPTEPRWSQPDGIWEDICVEVKVGVKSFRHFRDGLIQLAYYLAERPGKRGLLVLVDSVISESGLDGELKAARRILNSAVAGRLTVAWSRKGEYSGIPADLGEDFRKWLDELVRRAKSQGRVPRETFFEVLEVLVHEWLLKHGPMTSDWLARAVGCSYPTVANALRRLGPSIIRHRDRRVELKYFPRDEWSHLLAVADKVRSTVRFRDRSGQPRTSGDLFARAEKLKRRDIAYGGVLGARHYLPDLDLVGTPRLEISWHCPRGNADPDFVKALDPALERTQERDDPANLVIHVVRRADPFFEASPLGMKAADPVECLLDLQESRLEQQAMEFLRHFETTPARRP